MSEDSRIKQYDVIVIGSGAGNIVVDTALAAGKTIALIERKNWGGTCLNHGCIPTKILVHPADVLRESLLYYKIGLEPGSPTIDWPRLAKRVSDKILVNRDDVETYYGSYPNCDLYRGTASFVGEKELVVSLTSGGQARLTAESIVIGCGGTSNVPPIPGLEGTGYVTAESFFEEMPDALYKDVIFVGGADIGTEFCHILSTFGCKVTLVQRNVRLVPKQDEAISAHMLEQFEAVGIEVLLNQHTQSAYAEGDRKYLKIQDKTTGEQRTVSGEAIFISAGIVPNTADLNLEVAGVETDEKGWIRTNEYLETTAPGVYAIGDINGLMQLRHKANYEADIVGYNLFSRGAEEPPRFARYDVVPSATYSFPQTARCGLSEKDALDRGYKISVGIHRFSDVIKTYAMGIDADDTENGFVKLIVERHSRKLLGIHCSGPQAAILVQGVAWLMNAGRQPSAIRNEDIETELSKKWRPRQAEQSLEPNTVFALSRAMTIHPALSEVVGWAPGTLVDVD